MIAKTIAKLKYGYELVPPLAHFSYFSAIVLAFTLGGITWAKEGFLNGLVFGLVAGVVWFILFTGLILFATPPRPRTPKPWAPRSLYERENGLLVIGFVELMARKESPTEKFEIAREIVDLLGPDDDGEWVDYASELSKYYKELGTTGGK